MAKTKTAAIKWAREGEAEEHYVAITTQRQAEYRVSEAMALLSGLGFHVRHLSAAQGAVRASQGVENAPNGTVNLWIEF